MSEPSVRFGKSINTIQSQWDRIQDAFRDSYYRAERIPDNNERDAELERLNRRLQRVNDTARRYMENINRQPDQVSANSEMWRNLDIAVHTRDAEERQAAKSRFQELGAERRRTTYPRSVYMGRRNNRR